MKVYQTDEIRNIALVGGAKSGKTTLSECMIFEGGLINRRGSVDDKNTVSDYREIEHERQNSVSSTVLFAEFMGKKINIIDTPGFDDFVGEVISALKVADTGVMVINAQNGVEVGAEISWRYTSQVDTPVIFAINHLEHEKSNYTETLRQLKSQFGNNVTVCQYPLNEGIGFNQVIDLIKMKLYKFSDDGGAPEVLDIPDSEKDKAEELQAELIEKAAESNEELMEKFFENGSLTEQEMIGGIKEGLKTRGMFPVFCINAKHNMGVARLMEFINNSVPAPNEMPPVKTTEGKELSCDPTQDPALFVFKTVIESHLGEVSFFKLYNGELNEGIDLVNSTNGTKERVSQLFAMAGKKTREKLPKVAAGDIASTIKLKNTSTNETLNLAKNSDDVIEPIVFPAPKITMAVKAINTTDDEKLGSVLHQLHKVDHTFRIGYSKELRQMIAGGMGELHLNLIKWMVENLEKVSMEYITQKIPYRETITKSAKANYRHKKQSGGAGQFGEVHIMIEPFTEGMEYSSDFPVRGTTEENLDWGGKLIMINSIVGGAIDKSYMPAIFKGLMEKIENGPLTGSYARDIVVYVYDGKMHAVDSNELSFKLAARHAFREAFKNAGPKIMEPIYDVEVIVPEEKLGDVMTDLQGRRAIIMGMDADGHYQKIKAKVPLAEMNRYSTSLSSITSGRAMYSLEFGEYAPVPGDVQTQLLKEYEEQQGEDE